MDCFKTHLVRQNSNCIRYTSISGTGTNSWPTNANVNVTGWNVFPAQGRCIDSITSYSFTGLIIKDSVEICQGDSVLIGNNYQSMPGLYRDTIFGNSSCDSIFEITLKIVNEIELLRDTTICENDSIFLQNVWRKTAGVYSDTLSTTSSCDTILKTNLSIAPLDTVILSQNLCQRDTFDFNNQRLTQSGIYFANFSNLGGCDSTVKLNLNILPIDTAVLDTAICEGTAFNIDTFNLNNTGIYYVPIQRNGSCDSIIQVNLQVNQPDTTAIGASICPGDSFSFF